MGRKKIDLVCVPRRAKSGTICVELKLKDWRKALWQAAMNFQLGDESYIAVWHEHAHGVQKELALLDMYGVGLIVVEPRRARLIQRSQDRVVRIAREHKRDFYRLLITRV